MPIVRIEMWAGKENELKRKLARDITDVMVENVGCPRQRVTILFNEIPKENWVIGGEFCSDVPKDDK